MILFYMREFDTVEDNFWYPNHTRTKSKTNE